MSWTPQLCESSVVNARLLRIGWGPTPTNRINYSGWLFLMTAVYLAIGVLAFAAWRITGSDSYVRTFFQVPGAVLLVFLAAAQLWFSSQVLRQFGPGEAMRGVWLCITASAAFDLGGAMCSQILSLDSPVNPLRHIAWWSTASATMIRSYGQLLGGTCRFTLLAVAIGLALQAYRSTRLLGRLKAFDWILLLGMGGFVMAELWDIVQVAAGNGRPVSLAEMASWPVDTILWLLLAEALLLYRSARRMESGWLGLSWKALAVGVFLISLGTVSLWASRWGIIPWPWSAVFWYIWLPAATAFALGPAYQLEAIQAAYAAGAADKSRALSAVSAIRAAWPRSL